MATTEHISLLSQLDENGNRKLIYPVTSTEAVDGLEEFVKDNSPQRGVDYWTEEDVAEIKSYVDDAILGGAW